MHHKRFGRLITNQGSVPATPDNPKTKWRIPALWKPEATVRRLHTVSMSLLNLDHIAYGC